jgi:cytochrome c556
LALVVAVFAVVGVSSAQDKNKVPSIHDIMEQGHKGKKSQLSLLNSAVKAEKWEDAEKPAKKMKEFGEAIGKNTPDKGSAESWKKLTDTYKATTAEIFKAVEKKDKAAAEKELKKFGGSCKSCHDAHR